MLRPSVMYEILFAMPLPSVSAARSPNVGMTTFLNSHVELSALLMACSSDDGVPLMSLM